MPEEKKTVYDVLEILARLANFKGVSYEIGEIKDGRIKTIKNIKIEEIDLSRYPL
jgi:protein subunit release factor B